MTKRVILALWLAVLSSSVVAVQKSDDSVGKRNRTMAVSDLGFCALILRNFVDQDPIRRELYIFAAPDDVTESNLNNLFGLLSARFPKPEILEAWVYTDVGQMSILATSESGTAALSRKQAEALGGDKRATLQMAYYKRTKQVELFRYNPNDPLPGMKTIILRGNE